MSDHTPGPWGWTYDGSKDYTVGEADDPQAKPVAHVYAWQRNYDKAAANCALIAAAPDLLAACKAVATNGNSSYLEHNDPSFNTLGQVLAAIAKAEGTK